MSNAFVLKNGLNRCFEDGIKKVPRKSIAVFGKEDWRRIDECLSEWESKGWLRILNNPHNAEDMDICVEMLSFIDPSDEPPHWPNP